MEVENGFKIIRKTKKDFVIAICKECEKEWETNFYTLKKIKSCGCIKGYRFKPLPEFINGFRTIECLGFDKDKWIRWGKVECKVCKNIYKVDVNKLKYRKHCGCIKKGVIASKYKKQYPGIMESFHHMKQRCYNKNNKDFHNYGNRGIFICDSWLNDSNEFCEWSLKNGHKEGLTIDRIDNNKGYQPDNCRWVPMSEQGKNTRRVLNNRRIE